MNDYYEKNLTLLRANKRTNLTISINDELKKRFKEYCEKEGYFVSQKVEVLISAYLKKVS